MWTQRVLRAFLGLSVLSLPLFFSSLVQFLGISELLGSSEYDAVLHEFHRLALGFYKACESAPSSKHSSMGAKEQSPMWDCPLCASLTLVLVHWSVRVCSQQKDSLLNNELRTERDWCGSPHPTPSCILWLFLLIFWQVLGACVRLCHISLSSLSYLIQLGIRQEYLQIISHSIFSKVVLLKWAHVIVYTQLGSKGLTRLRSCS